MVQTQRFIGRCEEVHTPTKLIVREGKAHGWAGMDKDLELFADWFDEYLQPRKQSE